MNKLIFFVVALTFLFASCQAHTTETAEPLGAAVSNESTEDSSELPSELTQDAQYAACVEEALSGAPVHLTITSKDYDSIYLFGRTYYPTGDDQWPIQTEKKQAVLTTFVSESDLYPCSDEFPVLREACRQLNDYECVLFLADGEDSERITNRCVVADSLGVYVCWDGAYYIVTDSRGEEITQAITDMALALRDYMQEIARTYDDERQKDPFFILPINPEDTADAF